MTLLLDPPKDPNGKGIPILKDETECKEDAEPGDHFVVAGTVEDHATLRVVVYYPIEVGPYQESYTIPYANIKQRFRIPFKSIQQDGNPSHDYPPFEFLRLIVNDAAEEDEKDVVELKDQSEEYKWICCHAGPNNLYGAQRWKKCDQPRAAEQLTQSAKAGTLPRGFDIIAVGDSHCAIGGHSPVEGGGDQCATAIMAMEANALVQCAAAGGLDHVHFYRCRNP